MNLNQTIPGTAFLKGDPLPDPLTLSSAARTMLSVPMKAIEYASSRWIHQVSFTNRFQPDSCAVGPKEGYMSRLYYRRSLARYD